MKKQHYLTLYATLGVSPCATQAEISKAFQQLSRTIHPDVEGGGDPVAFVNLSSSYSVLKNPASRAHYDKTLVLMGQLCAACKGQGRIQRTIGYTKVVTQECTACEGTGTKEMP